MRAADPPSWAFQAVSFSSAWGGSGVALSKVGGRAGGVVGKKLWSLTAGASPGVAGHQVLCVTHLPQLAGYSDVHFRVDKEVSGERTLTTVQQLTEEERVEELASMLGTVTRVTRRSAQELLERVRSVKEKPL